MLLTHCPLWKIFNPLYKISHRKLNVDFCKPLKFSDPSLCSKYLLITYSLSGIYLDSRDTEISNLWSLTQKPPYKRGRQTHYKINKIWSILWWSCLPSDKGLRSIASELAFIYKTEISKLMLALPLYEIFVNMKWNYVYQRNL